MGLLQKISQSFGMGKDVNIQEYMDALELEASAEQIEDADFYVKPVALETEADATIVQEELNNGNIILLNVAPMSRQVAKLKHVMANLKVFVSGINGDIARIDEEKVLLTPARIKIVKKRKE